jgi:hypothetical protein
MVSEDQGHHFPEPIMLILGGNPIGNCLGRRWLAFLGRPSGRTVCSDPRSFTVSRTHVSSPYGRPRSMLTRTRSSSFAVICRPAHCSGTRLSRILCAAYLSKRPTPGAFHSRPLTMPSKGSLDRPSRRSERVVIANALSGGQGMNSLIVARSDPAHDSSWTASLRAATGIATVTESALFTSQ